MSFARWSSFVFFLCAGATGAQAPAPRLTDPTPTDPAITQGTLRNGLRYVIRRNEKPQRRAELRLVVRAGSVLEDDDQRGLAHYVEHMAFNGTARFPKQDIVSFLERSGMRFGADLNAYTSFDETVYMLQIPTDTAALLTTALDILQDWAGAITFDSTEFSRERGVVIEEWRTGRGAQQRIADRQFAVQFKGSRYAERQPIGSKESLDAARVSAARRFYREWYRPDLMAVVAVGDFDVKEMERAIRARFAPLKNPAVKRPRPSFDVPDHADTRVVVQADSEYPQSIAQVDWVLPARPRGTVGAWRANLIARFYNSLLGQRFSELSQREQTPFAYAFAGIGPLVPTRDGFTAAAVAKDSKFTEALTATLAEVERARRFGFTRTELQRQKTAVLRAYERNVSEASKTDSRQLAGQIVSSFLTQGTVSSAEQLLTLATAFVPNITLADVNAIAANWTPARNRTVSVAAPARADVTLPSDSALRAVFERVRSMRLTAYEDSTADHPLIATPPTPGRVTATRTIADLGITEWTLSNGIHVLLKPTDFKNDQVLMTSQQHGGYSVLSDRDYQVASLAEFVLGGAGAFSENQLRRMLTGKVATGGVAVGENVVSAYGSASPRDLSTMFELFWLNATAPRLDTALFAATRSQMKAEMQNSRNTPEQAFSDTTQVVMANYHPRVRLFQPEQLDSLDAVRAFTLYRQRLASFRDATFFFVGNFTLDGIRPLVERYIASLPTGPAETRAVDHGVRPPTGIVSRVVRKGTDAKAQTRFVFHGAFEYSWEHRLVLDALRQLLDMRLRDALREDKGGTYGVSVEAQGSWIPYARYDLAIGFGSSPERVEELATATLAVLDSARRVAPTAEEMTKIRETFLRAHETRLRENSAWLNWMADHFEDGRDQHATLQYEGLVKGLTARQVQEAAQRYLNLSQYARFTLLPERARPPQP